MPVTASCIKPHTDSSSMVLVMFVSLIASAAAGTRIVYKPSSYTSSVRSTAGGVAAEEGVPVLILISDAFIVLSKRMTTRSRRGSAPSAVGTVSATAERLTMLLPEKLVFLIHAMPGEIVTSISPVTEATN